MKRTQRRVETSPSQVVNAAPSGQVRLSLRSARLRSWSLLPLSWLGAITALFGCTVNHGELPELPSSQIVEKVDDSADVPQAPGGHPAPNDEGCSLTPIADCDALRIVVATQQAVDTLATWKCETLAGDLVIQAATCGAQAPIESLSALQDLREIAGELTIVDLPSTLEFSGLENLRRVKNLRMAGLEIHDLSAFAGLQSVDDLTLIDLPALQSLAGPSALRVVHSLHLQNLAALTDANALGTWDLNGSSVALIELPQLGALPAMSRTTALGSVLLQKIPNTWIELWFASLSQIRHRLEIVESRLESLQALLAIDLSELRSLHLSQLVNLNPQGTGALRLGQTLRDVTLIDLPKLETLDFLGDITIASPQGDARLHLIRVPLLRSLAGLNFGQSVQQIVVDSTGLDSLTPLPQRITESLIVQDNPALRSMVGTIELDHARLTLNNNALLHEVSAFAPSSTPRELNFINLANLGDLTMLAAIPQLAPESLVLDGLPRLTNLNDLAALNQVGAIYSGCEMACSPDENVVAAETRECATQMKVWHGKLVLRNNPALLSLAGLRTLQRIGGTVVMDGAAELASAATCEQIRGWREAASEAAELCGGWVDPQAIRQLCDRHSNE